MRDIYIGKTRLSALQNIRTLFRKEKWLLKLFGEEWCREHLLFSKPRKIDKTHPLFFHFSSYWSSEDFVRNIEHFSQSQPTLIKGLIKSLKADRDQKNIRSLINNLNVYCFLSKKNFPCEWEPKVILQKKNGTATKRPDLCINNNKQKIYLEIFSIHDSDEDEEKDRVMEELQIRVNRMKTNSYMISLSPHFRTIKAEHIEPIIRFIRRSIKSGKLPQIFNESTVLSFNYNDTPLAEIDFVRVRKNSGFWGSHSSGSHRRDDSFRLKKKILDKLDEEKFQLPPPPNFGGFYIVLDDTWSDIDDAVYAIFGTPSITFFSSGRDSISGNSTDGVIHHPKGAQLNYVDFIVIQSKKMIFSVEKEKNRNIKIILNAATKFSIEELEQIFN